MLVMLDTRNIYPLSDFQRNAKEFISRLKESQKPIVLTVNGKAAMVIQDAESYQTLLDELKVVQEQINEMKLVALRRDIQVGIDQIEAGEYTEYTEEALNEFFDDIMSEGRRDREQAA
jgi:prevent-host-death family protein